MHASSLHFSIYGTLLRHARWKPADRPLFSGNSFSEDRQKLVYKKNTDSEHQANEKPSMEGHCHFRWDPIAHHKACQQAKTIGKKG